MTPDRLNARGGPLQAFVFLALIWVGFRFLTWASPFPVSRLPEWTLPIPSFMGSVSEAWEGEDGGRRFAKRGTSSNLAKTARAMPEFIRPSGGATDPRVPDAAASIRASGSVAVGGAHELLLLAAFSRLPVPRGLAASTRSTADARPAPVTPFFDRPVQKRARRWSLDSWLFAREGSTRLTGGGTAPATYGASQAGAVARYRLAPKSQYHPELYARVAAPLAQLGDAEVAAGLSARPIGGVPVRVHAELRARRTGGKAETAPSIFAVTEIPPVGLPAGFRLEAYGQAGYVGGRYATAFADGQAKVDRRVVRLGKMDVRTGAGTWAGAQRGAARVDVGPTASAELSVGEVPARLAVDYRVRVAGRAAPGSGVAVTFSTGF